MPQEIFSLILLFIPLILGGVIAAVNANQVNDVTEKAEAKVRGWQARTSMRTGFFAKYFLNPPLWTIIKFCDWTDGFVHRGAKNGTRVAATLYLVGLWLLILYVAVIGVIAIVAIILALYIAAKVLGSSGGSSDVTYSRPRASRDEDDDIMANVGLRGKKVFAGTNWFNEELKGRIDDEGNLYRGTNWFNEDKIGRIDEEGNVYKGTNWMNEEKVGRIDGDGTLYKGSNWFTEEKTGRIDEEGTIHKGTSWFNEEKQGRAGD